MRWMLLASLFIFPAALGLAQIASGDGIVVVANVTNSDLALSKQQVRSLFMGSSVGRDLKVATLPPSSLTRVEFNTKVIGMTESRIQSYWAQMRFSGRKTEPLQIENEALLIEFLNNTPGAVGYLPASTPLPDNLSVIYQTQNN